MRHLSIPVLATVFLVEVCVNGQLNCVQAQGTSSTTSQKLNLLARLDPYPRQGYSSCWGYAAPDGREYALLGAQHGSSVIDITDTNAVREISFIPNLTSAWTELKVYRNYAYVVKDNVGAGIQIIDLSELPNRAVLVNTIRSVPQNHTLWIDEARGWLFTVGGDNTGVTVWDLKDPVNPTTISSFNGATYVHDMYVFGNRAYLAEILSKSFSIYDLTDIQNPRLISRYREESAPSISFHNMWTSTDGFTLFTTEESTGRPIRIWDMADERNPKEISRYTVPNSIPHNVHIKGNFMHIAHYGAGYRVVDVQDLRNPVEVAYYDEDEVIQPRFQQIWGIYPYFPSGKVILSSIKTGLHVVRF